MINSNFVNEMFIPQIQTLAKEFGVEEGVYANRFLLNENVRDSLLLASDYSNEDIENLRGN